MIARSSRGSLSNRDHFTSTEQGTKVNTCHNLNVDTAAFFVFLFWFKKLQKKKL